ncbi:MAG: dihydroorotase [Sphingobacteriia bacterium]|nr:dihydroorotase [Sphingobacteriia bacterium]
MTQKFFNRNSNKNNKLLFNARIIDPKSRSDFKGGILIENGLIKDFGPHLLNFNNVSDQFEKIDCKGHLLTPGLIDIQVHFREPGVTHKENILSGSKSSVAGGITRVVCQPNTKPVIDSKTVMDIIKDKAREAYCHIHVYAAISKNMEGNELSDMAMLAENGAVGFTDDGLPVMNSLLMRRAFEYARSLNKPIVQHAEDLQLSQGGCINEGKVSFELGVTGIPNISESAMVARDLQILELTGGHYHVLHVSTKESLELIKLAKQKGLNVTCEVAPHHFLLNDEAVLTYGTNAKMNPPLRSEADRLALIKGLKDGIFDAIATDHAPHDLESKNKPLSEATFGIVGMETMLPLSLELYHNYGMDLTEVLALMTNKPAEVIQIDAGRIEKGKIADLTLIDLDKEWVIETNNFHSKSKNSPFDGRKVKGRAIKTFVNGEMVYELEI